MAQVSRGLSYQDSTAILILLNANFLSPVFEKNEKLKTSRNWTFGCANIF